MSRGNIITILVVLIVGSFVGWQQFILTLNVDIANDAIGKLYFSHAVQFEQLQKIQTTLDHAKYCKMPSQNQP